VAKVKKGSLRNSGFFGSVLEVRVALSLVRTIKQLL
jgi:hypothetical protein